MNRDCVIDALLGIKSYFASRAIEAINDKNEIERIAFLAAQGHIDNAIGLLMQPHWVSVKDKLPEQGKDVLVYIERNAYRFDEVIRKREIAIGWHIDGRWHVDGCSKVVGFYWQELPEPPKEVSE